MNASTTAVVQTERRRFRLHEHPWLALLAVILASVFSIVLSGIVIFGALGLPNDAPTVQFAQGMAHMIVTGFVLAPFVLRLPKGKRTYKQFLDDIGATRVQPFVRLILLAFSCCAILMLSQAAASFVYRLFEGQPITWRFARSVFDVSGDLPPRSLGLLTTVPSMFEEVIFRGIVLTVFLSRYSERKLILFSSIGFGLIHLLNLVMGRELVWVLGQVVWATCIGLFTAPCSSRRAAFCPR